MCRFLAYLGEPLPAQHAAEIALLDGQGHTMSVRVGESGTVLALGRLDFAALLVGQDPTAFRLRRRLAGAVPAARQEVPEPHARVHGFDPMAVWGFLTSGTYVQCRRAGRWSPKGGFRRVLPHDQRGRREGAGPRRSAHPRRARGPGMAFGHEGLIDGGPSPVAAITRERAILLVLPRDVFARLFHGEDAVSRVFREAIRRDMLATLRQPLRP